VRAGQTPLRWRSAGIVAPRVLAACGGSRLASTLTLGRWHDPPVTPGEQWLAATWPFVRSHLPDAPGRALELGCGHLGGHVPSLRARGYDAIGIDPEAPEGPHYQRTTFESAELPEQVEAVVASTSLHHVADAAEVIDRIAATLRRGGTLVVVEWAWERFDPQTAEWCFERLQANAEEGWLHRRRDEWVTSQDDWQTYVHGWAEQEHLHRGDTLLRLLDQRFARRLLEEGPYFFPDLADTTEAEEQAAIDSGEIRAGRIDYVGELV
jgi:SAM-dependent methyltransferase